jgi:hypothetical protein
MSVINPDGRIAGVTFSNEICDGGESRQELLSSLYGKAPSVVKLVHVKFHNEETGEDEDAIKVHSMKLGKVLGYIPRDDIQKFWELEQMILVVGFYKDVYSGMLYIPEAPSGKQYSIIKSRLYKGELKTPPVYDKVAYSWAISNNE